LEHDNQLVIVEGVNLAAVAAEYDSDALVSRLQRIQEAGGHRRSVSAFVGYLASPSGLNGEAALVDWIRKKTDAKVFDLVRNGEKFAREVGSVVSKIEAPNRPQRTFSA
jgi:hypothetical protein